MKECKCEHKSALYNDMDTIKCTYCSGAVNKERLEEFIRYNTSNNMKGFEIQDDGTVTTSLKDKQNLEEAVRDICSVPVTKSKVRRIISQLLKEERARVIEDLDTNKIAEIQFNTEQEHHLNDGCHPTKCHHRKIDDLMKRLLKLLKE
jgi:hypothetical protein